MGKGTERRKHRRFAAGDRAAVLVASNAGNRAYRLLDISMQGLSFRYLGDEQMGYSPAEINILYGDEFQLMKVPVKNTFDCTLENGTMPMRKWGAQFIDLSPIQKNQLADFIKQHAAGDSARKPAAKGKGL